MATFGTFSCPAQIASTKRSPVRMSTSQTGREPGQDQKPAAEHDLMRPDVAWKQTQRCIIHTWCEELASVALPQVRHTDADQQTLHQTAETWQPEPAMATVNDTASPTSARLGSSASCGSQDEPWYSTQSAAILAPQRRGARRKNAPLEHCFWRRHLRSLHQSKTRPCEPAAPSIENVTGGKIPHCNLVHHLFWQG